ncbi:MAG: DEAD/DEAH box helicase, partial [Tenericutes bacterium]|nr:DEAD/DEAH box helicase [Mycoplasmatota bacterium]
MKFKELKLEKVILDAVEKIGFTEVTSIQELAIPEILKKKDLIGLAQTGTGKTAAFGLPIIDMLIREKKLDKKTRVLIVSPTRELAIQIRD